MLHVKTGLLGALLVLPLGLCGCQRAKTGDDRPHPTLEQTIAEQAKAAVADKLHEPEAARFKDVRAHRTDEKRGWYVCGLVNGKNLFGAYIGYTRFRVFVPDSSSLNLFPLIREDDDEQNESWDAGWKNECEGDGGKALRDLSEVETERLKREDAISVQRSIAATRDGPI